jgi:hypothetical protein
MLALFSLTTLLTGYTTARGWITDVYLASFIHRMSEIMFLSMLIFHLAITLKFYGLNWRRAVKGLRNENGNRIHGLRIIQRLSSWLIVIFAIMVIIPGLNGYEWFALATNEAVPFSLHRVFDVALASVIIIHVGIGIKFFTIRRRFRKKISNLFITTLIGSLLLVAVILQVDTSTSPIADPQAPIGSGPGPNPEDPFEQTIPQYWDAHAAISGRFYGFNVSDVETKRPDIFRNGSFSAFDVVAHLGERGVIDLDYSFDESMDTHVIHSINNRTSLWYQVVYSGGWPEINAYRMDHYLWKTGTELTVYTEDEDFIERIHDTFRDEVTRSDRNFGAVIIPEVFILAPDIELRFSNVEVTPYNLRRDVFQEDVVTAIDVILTLGEQGLITYRLQWYDEIGDADYVRSFWVESINGKESIGTCGWVYEAGAQELHGFNGNHIHLPSDVRPLTSPQYVLYFWICI